MKIKKFNESNNKQWTKQSLVNLFVDNQRIRKQIRDIEELLVEYFTENKQLLKQKLRDEIEDNYPFEINLLLMNGEIEIEFSWDDGEEGYNQVLDGQTLDDIIEFINNADMFRDSKKYNL